MKKLIIFLWKNGQYTNFLLMDVDGHENLALEGMKIILKNKKLKFAIIETTNYTDKFIYKLYEKNGFMLLSDQNNKDAVKNRF